MLDHVTIAMTDLKRSQAFYDDVLQVLGITRLYAEGTEFAGYGIGGKAFFWIGQRDGRQTGSHIAFTSQTRADVGVRPHYHESYYGAFVLDPDGHNIEAVCHRGDDDL